MHGREKWDDEDLGGPVEEDGDDREADEHDGLEDEIALHAVNTWLDIDGDDDLAQAQREALVAVAQEALAKKAQREARMHAVRGRREAQERSDALAVVERRAFTRRAQEAHQQAVDAAHAARVEESGRAARRHQALRREELRREALRLEALRQEQLLQDGLRRAAVARRPTATASRPPAARSLVQPQGRMPPVPALDAEEDDSDEIDLDAVAAFRQAPTTATREVLAEAAVKDPPAGTTAAGSISGPSDAQELSALTGAVLADWRARLGLTQQAAADRLGVRQGTVSKAESRSDALLGPALRGALADALGGTPRPA